jgi:O-antigen/teichoic acid export membrane protein
MSIVRTLVGYAPAVVLPRIVSMVLVLVLTRLISKEEYGLFALVMTIAEAIDSVVSNWVRMALARFASGYSAQFGREALRGLVIWLITLVPAVAAAVVFGVMTRADRTVEFLGAVVLFLTASGILRFPSTVMSVQADRNGIVAMEAIKAFTVLVLGVAIAWISGSFFAQTLVYAAVTTAVGVWGAARCLRRLDLHAGPIEPLTSFLSYGLPIIPTAIVAAVVSSSDRIFLDRLVSTEAVAFYAAGVMLARQPMEFLFSLAGVRVFPLLMEDYERGGDASARLRMAELISSVTFIAMPAAAGILLVAEPMCRLLLAPDYAEAAMLVLPPAVFAALFTGYKAFVLEQVYHMKKRVGLSGLVTVPAAVIGVLAMTLLVPVWGVWGCALAFLIQNMALFAISFVVTRRLMRFAIPWADLGRTAAATAVMVFVLLALHPLLGALPLIANLLASIILGVAAFALAALFFRPEPLEDLLPERWQRKRG